MVMKRFLWITNWNWFREILLNPSKIMEKAQFSNAGSMTSNSSSPTFEIMYWMYIIASKVRIAFFLSPINS